MSEDKDADTRFKLTGINASIKGQQSDVERKRKLIESLTEEVEQKPRELPQRKQLVAQIPENGKLGQKFTIKLGKRFDSVNLKVYQGETIEEIAGNTNIVHDKTEKNKDEISYDFYDPVPLQQKIINGLLAGKYLVKVEAHGNDAEDQLEQERIVNINT